MSSLLCSLIKSCFLRLWEVLPRLFLLDAYIKCLIFWESFVFEFNTDRNSQKYKLKRKRLRKRFVCFTSRNPRHCYPQNLKDRHFPACFMFNLQFHNTPHDLKDILQINSFTWNQRRESKKITFLVGILKWEIKKILKNITEWFEGPFKDYLVN